MPTLEDYLAMFQVDPQDLKRQQISGLLAGMGQGLLSAPGMRGVANMGMGGYQGAQDARANVQSEAMNKLKQRALAQQMASGDMDYQAKQDAVKQRGLLDAAAQSSMIPGSPEMGPPTPQGAMQPAVPGSFDWNKYSTQLAGIDPMRALQVNQAMVKESPLDKFKPEHYTPESLQKFMQTRNPADLKLFEKKENPVGKINPSDYTPASMKAFLGSGDYAQLVAVDKRPQTTIVNQQESAYAKKIGESNAELFSAYQKAGRDAGASIGRLNAIDKLLAGIDTNALTPVGMKVSGVAKALGMDIDPKLGPKQAAEAISNEMALLSRQGNMPGAMSDKDREFLQAMNPNLGQTPEGRRQLIETRKKIAEREQQVAKMARDYAAKNKGQLDSGFEAELADYVEKNPLFADQAPPRNAGPTGVIRFSDLPPR